MIQPIVSFFGNARNALTAYTTENSFGETMPIGTRLRAEDGRANIIGDRLRQQRMGRKITQVEMLQLIEAATNGEWKPALQDYKRLEGGRRTCLDVETVCLAKILNCSVGWLLVGDEDRPITSPSSATEHSLLSDT